MRTRPQEFDVIIVLGGPPAAMRRRAAHGIRLFRQGRSAALLLSGRGNKSRIEAEVMREMALAAGMRDADLALETDSRSTWENAVCCARIMARRGWRSALVVTDGVHLPRALLAFRAAGIRARGSPVGGWHEETVLGLVGHLAHEAVGLAWYGLRALLARRGGAAQGNRRGA